MSYSRSKSFVCQFALNTPPIAMCVVPCGAYMIFDPKSENLSSCSCSWCVAHPGRSVSTKPYVVLER